MKAKSFLLYGIAAIVLLQTFLLSGCENKKGTPGNGIPVDEGRAARHVIPYDSVRYYIDAFAEGKKELGAQLKDSSFLTSRFNMPVAEMFNRDAIAALLNAPDAQGVRIYLGRKPNGEVVFVLVPTNRKGKDIRVKLLNTTARKAQPAEAAAGDPVAGADEAQGMENGQRCPSICDENR